MSMAMAMAGGLRWCKGIVNSFHFNPLQLEDWDTRKLVSQRVVVVYITYLTISALRAASMLPLDRSRQPDCVMGINGEASATNLASFGLHKRWNN